MSLIEQALRRTQDPLVPTPPAAPPTKRGPQEPPGSSQSSPAHSWPVTPPAPTPSSSALPSHPLLAVTLSILALTLILVIGGALWIERTMHATPLPAIRETRRTAAPSPSRVAATASIPQAVPASARPSSPPKQAQPEPEAVQIRTPPASAPEPKHPSMPPQTPPVNPESQLVLSGVVEGAGESYAVINGTIVGVGEDVEGLTLVAIANGGVKLRHADGRELVLRVPR